MRLRPALLGSAFLLTRLLRGVTDGLSYLSAVNLISTHTPLARRDGAYDLRPYNLRQFLLTRLLRGVTHTLKKKPSEQSDFYSHASCEA